MQPCVEGRAMERGRGRGGPWRQSLSKERFTFKKTERKKQQQGPRSDLGSGLAETHVRTHEMQMIGAPSTTLPSPMVPEDLPLRVYPPGVHMANH